MKGSLWHRLWRGEEGVSAIEFAVVGGSLSLLLLGVLDFGIGFWEKIQAGDAAQAGAQYAARNGYDSARIQTAVTRATTLSGVQASPAPTPTSGGPDARSGVTAAI